MRRRMASGLVVDWRRGREALDVCDALLGAPFRGVPLAGISDDPVVVGLEPSAILPWGVLVLVKLELCGHDYISPRWVHVGSSWLQHADPMRACQAR